MLRAVDTDTSTAGSLLDLTNPVYGKIVTFLYQEAAALDARQFDAWIQMLAEDIRYWMPVRETRGVSDKPGAKSIGHFDDNYVSLCGRVGRLKTKSAWAEDPPSRTRRFVTNVLVRDLGSDGEYAVNSYLLLTRNRAEESDFHHLSCERRDRLRFSAGVFKLCRREIVMDQAVLGMPNLAIFL